MDNVLNIISVAFVFAVGAVVVVVGGGGAAVVVVLIVFIVDVPAVGFSAYLVFLMVALSSIIVLINPLFLAEAACCCDDREPEMFQIVTKVITTLQRLKCYY